MAKRITQFNFDFLNNDESEQTSIAEPNREEEGRAEISEVKEIEKNDEIIIESKPKKIEKLNDAQIKQSFNQTPLDFTVGNLEKFHEIYKDKEKSFRNLQLDNDIYDKIKLMKTILNDKSTINEYINSAVNFAINKLYDDFKYTKEYKDFKKLF